MKIKINNTTYIVEVFKGANYVKSTYPNIYKHGVREMYILRKPNSKSDNLYTCNKFINGKFSKPLKTYNPN